MGGTIIKVPFAEWWQVLVTGQYEGQRGLFIHPVSDPPVLAGNGTIGLEILEDLPDVDAVIAPLGGGGLLAGIACVMRSERPEAKTYAAEPATAAPLAQSFAAGHASTFAGWQASFVDGAGGRSVLNSMWPLLRDTVSESLVVSLDEAASGMRLVAERVHVIAEGAAACAIAAALSPAMAERGHKKVVAVVSGGNIDLKRFAEIVGACG